MLITVFTPTYNRAHLLPRLYESLCRQTFRDFEWVVVDDGSTDGTEECVAAMCNEQCVMHNSFTIRYFQQANGGKHRAINRGMKAAQGELFLILDSDDSLPETSLEKIAFYYQQIKDNSSFGGVCGYMAHHNGTIIGRGNDAPLLDANTLELRYKYHVQGDMCEVFRTPVLKEHPFPEIADERFCPEALVWNRIARKYKLRVFHEVIYFRDYLDGGLSDKIIRIRMESPMASMMTYAEMLGYDIPLKEKAKSAVNYWRFRLCSDAKDKPQIPWYWHWTMPLGWLMHRRDLRHVPENCIMHNV